MADNEARAKVTLDLDNAEFVSKLKESLGLMGQIGSAESLSGAVDTFMKIGAVVGVATASVALFKSSLDTALEGEKLLKIEQQFDAIAASVGLVASKLKNDLINATRGMVDETDLLQMANKAMIALGDNAGRIPEILEVSRKAASIAGKEMTAAFEDFSSAVASGNVRTLRQYGIFVDTEKAVKAYAHELGVSVDVLSEQGKKQAIVNAAMDQAHEKFDDLKTQSMVVGSALQQMKVAWTELGETIAKTAAKSAQSQTGFLKGVLDLGKGLAQVATSAWITVFGDEADRLNDKIPKLNKQIEAQRALLQKMETETVTPGLEGFHEQELKFNKQKLADLEKELSLLTKRKEEIEPAKVEDKKAKTEAEIAEDNRLRDINRDKQKAKELEFEKDVLNAHKEYLAAREQNVTTANEAENILRQQQELIEAEHQEKLKALNKKYLEDKFLNQAQYKQMIEDLEAAKNERIAAMEWELQDKRIAAMERAANRAKTLTEGIQAGFAVEGARATKEFNNMGAVGSNAFHAIGNNAANAFIALGNGTKTAGEAMRMFMFGAIADIAEAQGKTMLLASIWPVNPAGLAAAGGLLALSGLLRGLAGGSAKGIGGGGEAGAGGGFTPGGTSGAADLTSPPAIQEQQQKKTVTVQIQGNYFETDQTRTRLMDMIREAGDFTEFNLRKIGQ